MHGFNLTSVHSSWQECIKQALTAMDAAYLQALAKDNAWLPGPDKIFNAFSLPVDKVNYVLFGESPYPRPESANGYAFWDAAVKELWSDVGLSKRVNRATSLRNLMKMLLVAENALSPTHTGQAQIASLNKDNFVQTNAQLFQNLLKKGFLLLNATLVLQEHHSPSKDAKAWFPFMSHLLKFLLTRRPHVQLILFGRIANPVNQLITTPIKRLYAEHPYNHSFITNEEVLNFFKPLHLLNK